MFIIGYFIFLLNVKKNAGHGNSCYIIKNKADYYHLLQEVRVNDRWEDWILFMLNAVEETSRQAIHQIAAIKPFLKHTMTDIELLQQIRNFRDKNIGLFVS